MLLIWTGPEELEKQRVGMHSESLVGGSVVESKEFLTAKLTLCSHSSSGSFPCQKKV